MHMCACAECGGGDVHESVGSPGKAIYHGFSGAHDVRPTSP